MVISVMEPRPTTIENKPNRFIGGVTHGTTFGTPGWGRRWRRVVDTLTGGLLH